MDKNQKSCIDFAIQAKPLELYVPEEQSGIRYHIWRLVTSGPFENFIMLLIVCNTILLMLKVSLQFWENKVSSKGGFKSEDSGEFLHCQHKYSKSLSWA